MKKQSSFQQTPPFDLRPASVEEAGLFYSNDERDEALGTVGHLRMDFGSGGKGFYHTWWPHNGDHFNTPEFKEALQDECAFRCIDCEIPSLREAVDDAIDQEGGIELANEFAKNLAQKGQAWHETDWIKYKALLSVTGHPRLQDAIQLMHGLDDYDLRPDVAATWDYAEVVLREKYPDLPEELFQTPQAAMVGRQMLEENHAAITDYGLFRRKDNGQLPVFQREPQAMDSPQMGGM